MIYPSYFPVDLENKAEKIVFEKLFILKDKYDIFYARKFVALSNAERSEYEIDFIICLPKRAIICLEIKGGIISYNGISGKWFQYSQAIIPSPDIQASSATHSLIKRYPEIGKKLPVGWALCFPDCEIPYGNELPTSVSTNTIIDQNGLFYIDKALDSIFENLIDQFPNKEGCKNWEYENFKNGLLRGIGFVQLLGTRFKQDEERYIQLADQQLEIFKHFIENERILVYGPAGSGKTIIAKTLAQELASNGEKVMLLCFNRTLGNKLSYETGIRNNPNIITGTFHSFAKRSIETNDPNWWTNADKKTNGFWDIEVPAKLDELLTNDNQEKIDCLIIDEGQDFKEFWFELLYKLLKPDGKVIIFLDKMQDIFNRNVEIPEISKYFRFSLIKNCRNTKKIVHYLEEVVCERIETENTPEGDDVVYKICKNEIELQSKLVSDTKELLLNQRISSDQILLILNSEKKDSSIASINKIGKYDLKYLDNKARFEMDSIHFTTIETFKGLEADIVLVIDIQKIPQNDKKKKLYTEASRAKHKLFVYEVKK